MSREKKLECDTVAAARRFVEAFGDRDAAALSTFFAPKKMERRRMGSITAFTAWAMLNASPC